MANAEKISPICDFVKPNSLMIWGAATEIVVRSRYEMR